MEQDATRYRLVPVKGVYVFARIYFIVHVLLFCFLASDQLEVCGADSGCAKGPIQDHPSQCLKNCPQRDGPYLDPYNWKPLCEKNFSQGVCPYSFPICVEGNCLRSSAQTGQAVVVIEFVAVALMSVCFCMFASATNAEGGLLIPDDQARLAFLGIGVLVNLDYHYWLHAQGWADGYIYRSLLPYAAVFNYLIIAGFLFCAVATAPSRGPGHGSKSWVEWSHMLSVTYLGLCFMSANFINSDSFNGDPYFVGIGPIFWLTMVFDSNEHVAYLTSDEQNGNYLAAFSTALFMWKTVVAFLFNNTWQFGHFFDLSIPFAKMVLLSIDTGIHNPQPVLDIFTGPDYGSSTLGKLYSRSSSWGFRSLLQFVNFLWNSMYIAFTLDLQVNEIQGGPTWGSTPKAFVVYGILVLSLVGTAASGAGFLGAWSKQSYIFDEKFRFSLAVKNAMLWLKIILLWWLVAEPQTSINTFIIFMNNFITLGVATYSAHSSTKKGRQSTKMTKEVCAPLVFSLAFMVLMITWKAVVSTLLIAKFFRSPWLEEVPVWDIPALPAFWVMIFGTLEVEVSRYLQSCEERVDLASEPDVRTLRSACLWAAWLFPLNITCTVVLPGMTSGLWQGLFGPSEKYGCGFLHIWVSVLSLASWLATIVMVVTSQPRPSSSPRQMDGSRLLDMEGSSRGLGMGCASACDGTFNSMRTQTTTAS
eukprot:TRINITY_DN91659_c0_g1_i1.p1 TRINITY_DN91659_c0_g1~~TRINITY_DN91659_c0_g1_i1.p1  ORF type:complete len:699 (+),score=73.00 TRINITY_DN91659_c0_g1_i1:55-2151(+)